MTDVKLTMSPLKRAANLNSFKFQCAKQCNLKYSKSLKYAGFEVIFWKESKHGLEHTEKTSECIISDYHWTAEKEK